MKKYLIYTVLTACILGIASCSKDCDHPDFAGSGNVIVAFSLSDGNSEHELTIYRDSLVFYAPHDFNFANANVVFEISEGAVISPNPESLEDWSENTDFTVTAANGTNSRKYSYKVHIAKYEKLYNKVAQLTTQSEVDDFAAKQYTRLVGLIIDSEEEDKIIDLSGLNSIEQIDFNLKIKGFYGRELNGFENLKKVTNFSIANDSITSLNLPKLEEVTNFLVGQFNDEIGSFSCPVLSNISCPALRLVKNNFIIQAVHTSNEGFSVLSEIGGEVILNGRFTNMKGFENLTRLEYLSIVCNSLLSLEGLENLKTVKNTFMLQFCQKLESLQGLNLENVGTININNSIRIKDITALSKITELDNLFFSGIIDLESFEGLHNIKNIKGVLSLQHIGGKDWSSWPATPFGVDNLNGLRGLQKVGKKITINYCWNLNDYSGLAGIASSFYGDWIVGRNKYNPTWEEFQEGKYTEN